MFQPKNHYPAVPAGNIKKTSLAMSLAIGLGGYASTPMAALSTSTLNFTLGTQETVACTYGTTPPCNKATYNITDIVGSYFSMDTDGNGVSPGEKVPIGSKNGIVMGTAQAATGSHSGPINGTESPNIDEPWEFFGNTGMHQTLSPVTVTTPGATNTIDLSGWNVTWNGIPNIPLVATSPSTVTCDTTACSNNEGYVLDGAFHVSGAGFTTVAYTVHLEGTVLAAGAGPNAGDVSAKTIAGNLVNINVLDSVTSSTPITDDSISLPVLPSNGTATGNADNTVDYTPNTAPDFVGTDTFDYTVDNASGTSNPGTVTVDVENNVAPVANDDSGSSNATALDNAGGNLEIDILANDTDVNNDPGLPGGIDVTKVTVLTQPSTGSCAADATTGKLIYSQTPPSVTVSTACTYEVMDIDSFGTPLTSNVATAAIDITALESDWPPSLDPDIIPFLIYNDGVPNASGNTADQPASGTYFSMDVSANTTIYTTLTKGPDGGFVIGYDQLATGSHTGVPTGNETASIDLGWNFFGNTGLTFTKNGGIIGNTDGTLKFSGEPSINGGQGRYQITWNGIPEIDLGGSDQFPEDLGFALINCDPAPCADGSTYDLTYEAHVPPGDPSGFGGVQYRLVMDGVVAFLDGSFQTSSGTFSVEERLQAGDSTIPSDPDSEIQCAGGCFDYTVTGVTGPTVSVVLPLNGGVPASTTGTVQLRVLRDGVWGNFDTSGNNSVLSAALTSGGPFGSTCPLPGDAAYGDLTEGHQCLQVTIEDNGPNDKDSAVGTISDPSGLGIPTIVTGPDNRKSGTSGCTVATTPVSPLRGGAWWLLAGLASWIGWRRRQSKLN